MLAVVAPTIPEHPYWNHGCCTPCLATSLHSAGVDQLDEAEVQTMLSEAINRIIKHHHKSLKERVSWAQLMCGEMGLVFSLIQVGCPIRVRLIYV